MLAVSRPWRVRMLGLFRRHARKQPSGADCYLMLGCFERMLYPEVSRAAQWLLPNLAAPPDQGCCGALHAHNGESGKGKEMARRLGEQLPGLIITTAGGCVAHLAGVLGPERVRELSQHLVMTGAAPTGELRVDGRRARVALQDSCHLRNGLGVHQQPRALIAAVADFVPVPGDDSCCGSAGSYSLLRPRDSARILAPKLDAVEAADVDYLVAVNPGCLRQLRIRLRRRGSRIRVVHLAELLAAAAAGEQAGPPTAGWRGIRSRGKRVEGPSRDTGGWSA
jgi:glycolate oxidase iron-sulfur subunit